MDTTAINLPLLKQSRAEMAKQLEINPLFRAIQLIDEAIAILERGNTADQSIPSSMQTRKTPDQIDAVAEAIIRHFCWTKNASLKLTDLIEVLRRQGVDLPTSQHAAIASVGALLGKRKEVFEKTASGHWKLKDDYYQTLLRDSEPRVA